MWLAYGGMLNWFRSYLSDKSQYVSVHAVLSRPFDLDYGIPQRLMFRASVVQNICVQAIYDRGTLSC